MDLIKYQYRSPQIETLEKDEEIIHISLLRWKNMIKASYTIILCVQMESWHNSSLINPIIREVTHQFAFTMEGYSATYCTSMACLYTMAYKWKC